MDHGGEIFQRGLRKYDIKAPVISTGRYQTHKKYDIIKFMSKFFKIHKSKIE